MPVESSADIVQQHPMVGKRFTDTESVFEITDVIPSTDSCKVICKVTLSDTGTEYTTNIILEKPLITGNEIIENFIRNGFSQID